ncbi:MAG: helix-turn-helix domain-containing protein [Treponema sp.]|nr:helix-turn-helix domain-containing protein [Treponema sp.]
MDIKQVLASNIKLHRKMLGLSQSKLAEQINSSTNYIAMIELGRKFPSAPMIEKIAGALRIDSYKLFSVKTNTITSVDTLYKCILSDIEEIIRQRLSELDVDCAG